MSIIQPIVHYTLHLLVPGLIAWLFFRKNWKQVWLIFLATMAVDLDHLLADPVFDPNRNSINFHPLHSYWAIGFYVLFLIPSRTRIVAIGLLFHMATDFQDSLW